MAWTEPTPYQLALWAWLGLGAVAFAASLRLRAPYGRHARGGWGPELDNRLAWFLMEVPVLAVFHAFFWTAGGPKTLPVLVFAGAFSFHYGYRALIYPWRLRTARKRMPWAVAGMAMLFNLGNGYFLGHGLGAPTPYFGDAPGADWPSANAWIGGLLFLAGWAVNFTADGHLIGLRRPGETGYRIPTHPLFRRVSCPNHAGEMVEWIGFAVLTAHPAAAVFAAWTILNVLPRSLAHHRWYRERFPDYPPQRKALVPGLL